MNKLTKEQEDFIIESIKEGFESGHSIYDHDDLKALLKESGLFKNNYKLAEDRYFELLDYGPSGFYEEFPNLNWSSDFIEEYGY